MMKLTFDPVQGVAYICFREKPVQARTISVGEEINIDVAEDGTVYGIELLNAYDQLTADDLNALVVVNQATGESAQVRLPV